MSYISIIQGPGLRECETKESQTWQHVNTKEVASHLFLYHPFFPELIHL